MAGKNSRKEKKQTGGSVHPSPHDLTALHDIKSFYARLEKVVKHLMTIRPYVMESLGKAGPHDVMLIRPRDIDPNVPSILAAGGFHGDEAAGPWGILEFLENADEETLKNVNYSFLPLVNPTGFALATRNNDHDENPNRGFIMMPSYEHKGKVVYPSREGDILIGHLSKLMALAKDGFITQHEDNRMEESYTYINEAGQEPSPFAYALRDTLARHFPIMGDGGNDRLPDENLRDGIILNDKDSSFENLLQHYGVPRLATTETPASPAISIRKRIICNTELTHIFSQFTAKNYKPGPIPAHNADALSDIDDIITKPEKAPADFPRLHDIDYFYERLEKAFKRIAKMRPYKMKSMGKVGGHDVYMIRPQKLKQRAPSIMATAGFHGEEPAGPWGLLEFLETVDEKTLQSVNYSFLPLVNPTGFEKGERLNMYGENPNCGYAATDPEVNAATTGVNRYPSREGTLLLGNINEILRLSRDGFLTQHEDTSLKKGAYLWINETDPQWNADNPSPFAQILREALTRHLDLAPDGGLPRNGFVYGSLADAFEDILIFHGIPRTFTAETSQNEKALARIACHTDLTKSFAEFSARHYKAERSFEKKSNKGPQPA